VGQPASKLVNLCQSVGGTCQTSLGSYSVPAGEALVITDIEWNAPSNAQQGGFDDLIVQSNGATLALFSNLVDRYSIFAGQVHLTTGIVFPPGSTPNVSTGSGEPGLSVNLQGYLVPNQ